MLANERERRVMVDTMLSDVRGRAGDAAEGERVLLRGVDNVYKSMVLQMVPHSKGLINREQLVLLEVVNRSLLVHLKLFKTLRKRQLNGRTTERLLRSSVACENYSIIDLDMQIDGGVIRLH